jgi:hypothetical protein
MCDDNWRSIGELAGNVIERLGISGTGTGAAMTAPQPGPRDERGVPSRSGMKERGTVRSHASYPDAAREVAGRGIQGSTCIWPGTAGHSLNANASRDRRTVFCTAPSTEAHASAVRRSLPV